MSATPNTAEGDWVPITISKDGRRIEPAAGGIISGLLSLGPLVTLRLRLSLAPPPLWTESFIRTIGSQTASGVLGQVAAPTVTVDRIAWTVPRAHTEMAFGAVSAAVQGANDSFSRALPRVKEVEAKEQEMAQADQAELEELNEKLKGFEF